MTRKYRTLAILVAIIILLDQFTKLLVQRSLDLHQSIPIIPHLLDITYIRNPGAAFGLFSNGASLVVNTFFVVITAGAALVILLLYRSTSPDLKARLAGLSLILAGALGNFLDRIRYGEVVDFIDFHWFRYHWPSFNVADSSICLGVVLILWSSLKVRGARRGER